MVPDYHSDMVSYHTDSGHGWSEGDTGHIDEMTGESAFFFLTFCYYFVILLLLFTSCMQNFTASYFLKTRDWVTVKANGIRLQIKKLDKNQQLKER